MWLFGAEHRITEVGSMNIFFVLRDRDNPSTVTLITPSLDCGDILPGVTRLSIIELVQQSGDQMFKKSSIRIKVAESNITMNDLLKAQQDGTLLEAFGAGTAAVISPISAIVYKGQEIKLPSGDKIGPIAKLLLDQLLDIQYGRVDHPWSVLI